MAPPPPPPRDRTAHICQLDGEIGVGAAPARPVPTLWVIPRVLHRQSGR